jgi:SAM-dependent methyltransferase
VFDKIYKWADCLEIMPISSKDGLKEYYKKQKVVDTYVKDRFSTPLGRYMHVSQVLFLNKFVKGKRIMDLACGPARLSKDIRGFVEAYALDYSDEMIQIAESILLGWKIKKVDAFAFSLKEEFDLIYSFRFIRHYHLKERVKVYTQIKKHLKKDGIFIFDAVNYDKSYHVRKRKGFHHYQIYDRLYKKKDLIKELKENGFKDIKLYPCLNHLYTITAISKLTAAISIPGWGYKLIRSLEKIPSNNPLEWMIICRKK